MMLRLTFAARITFLVLTTLALAWIAGAALSILANGDDGRLSVTQIIGLVELTEKLDAGDRRRLIDAATSAVMTVAVADGLSVPPPAGWPSGRLSQTFGRLEAGLAGRPLSVSPSTRIGPVRRWARSFFAEPVDVEIRVGLRTGETMTIDIREPVPVNTAGIPVGLGAGLFGTVVALLALVIMHRSTRPLAELAAAADRIDLSSPPITIPVGRTTPPEIRALVTAFDRLQGRLSELMQSRLAMVGGISHDVRTFATRLRLRIDGIADAGERQRATDDIGAMIRLLDDAVLASRGGAAGLDQALVDVIEVLRAEADDRVRAGAAVDCVPGMPDEALVLGDALALRRIVANLLDNALKYGRVAHLGAAIGPDKVVITVDDEGPGIPAEARAAMLEPFTRLEGSRSRDTGGAGLGLAIAANLVEAQGGGLAIADAPSGGARLVVDLPLFRPA